MTNGLVGKIGILGGSFNSAHLGHLYISTEVKKLLGLDFVLWLVANHNPFKPNQAGFKTRYQSALNFSKPVWIKVSDFEYKQQVKNSFDSLSLLMLKNPLANFVWLMGADNFCQLDNWHRADDIIKMVPIAIVPRLGDRPRNSKIAAKYASAILPHHKFSTLTQINPPALGFLSIKSYDISSSKLRKQN